MGCKRMRIPKKNRIQNMAMAVAKLQSELCI